MNNLDRRTFIKLAGLTTVAAYIPGCNLFDRSQNALPKIGLQLYTIRKEIETDLESAVGKIAEMGYSGIETYFLPESIELSRAAKLFADLKLEVLGMHCELPEGDQKDVLLKTADAYKSDKAVYHGWPQDDKYSSLENIKRTVERYNEANHFCKSNGMKFGLHNHWWEFTKTEDYLPFYYLKENLEPDIFFEIDIYWAKTAGLDPAKIISDFGDRASLLHVKDGAATNPPVHKQQILGTGNVNISHVLKAAEKHAKWAIVEFDEYEGDIFDALQKSYNYLAVNKLAGGKV